VYDIATTMEREQMVARSACLTYNIKRFQKHSSKALPRTIFRAVFSYSAHYHSDRRVFSQHVPDRDSIVRGKEVERVSNPLLVLDYDTVAKKGKHQCLVG
jgi:hypothetical protein